MLIPDNIKEFDSNGERLMYHRFKTDHHSSEFIILHSVFTNTHITSVSGELDFLILAPGLGFFALEVKHGRVERKDGTWIFTNRNGKATHKTKGPFRQVEDTKHSIRNYLLDTASTNKKLSKRLSKILFATGVAFTSMKDESLNMGPEGFPWQIFTEEDFRLPISKYIQRLSEGWHEEYSNRVWYDPDLSRPTIKDCEEVLKIIRGDFQIDYSELNRISDNQKQIEEFTQEQFKVLDFTDFNDRCLIEGQAGTGKTIIALELARRRIKDGKKVGFFCFNQMLGEKLNKSLRKVFNYENEFYAGTLHKYLLYQVSTEVEPNFDDEFYSEKLPLEYLIQNESISEEDKFDELIIDEAQDLITENYLQVFDWMLKGGIKNGKWTMFGDFTNQAIYINNPIAAKHLLSDYAFFSNVPPLKLNCRNTKRITKHNTLVTGVELPEFSTFTITGNSIDVQCPISNKQQDIVENHIRKLIDSGIEPQKISLLSPRKFENTYLAESAFISQLQQKGLIISTIHSYKGLENAIVILYDFQEISSERALHLLYVGISRATQELFIVLNKELETAYQNLINANLSKIK